MQKNCGQEAQYGEADGHNNIESPRWQAGQGQHNERTKIPDEGEDCRNSRKVTAATRPAMAAVQLHQKDGEYEGSSCVSEDIYEQ